MKSLLALDPSPPTLMVKSRVGVKIILSMSSLMHLKILGVTPNSARKYLDFVSVWQARIKCPFTLMIELDEYMLAVRFSFDQIWHRSDYCHLYHATSLI